MIPIVLRGIIMRGNNPDRWHFTVQTNAHGFSYVYAYQTAWDPVTKRSRRVAKKYVGRLHEDGRVDVSPKFAASVPAYANGEFYYGADKTLVDKAAYLTDFPAKPGPAPEADEEPEDEPSTRILGVTWAAEQIAQQSGMAEDLAACFGPELGRDLLNLAFYKLDSKNAMAGFADWAQQVWLQSSRRLSGQRISELLAQIGRDDFDRFFRRRHDRRLAQCTTDKRRPCYALDNTSISTYSRTIVDSAYGHAKRDPELRQINYTFVCDQETGDIVFVHTYEGSINDVTALQEILYRMKNAGLDLERVILVTDRGYSSIRNIQKMLNLELRFIQGVRVHEDVVKKYLDQYRESLGNLAFYNSDLEAYARTVAEPWMEDREFGRITQNVYLHLYRAPGVDEKARIELVAKAEEILKFKREHATVPPALWQENSRFVMEVTENGKKSWMCNFKAIEEECRYAGMLVLRSNETADPFEALRAYRLRNTVELDFNQYKNWVDGDRLRCTESSYLGKLFVTTLAAALRVMMLNRARMAKSFDLSKPYDSMDGVFGKLRGLYADKRPDAKAWVTRTITKKQREMFALLGVPTPRRVLR